MTQHGTHISLNILMPESRNYRCFVISGCRQLDEALVWFCVCTPSSRKLAVPRETRSSPALASPRPDRALGGAWRASRPAQGLLGDVVLPPGLRARLCPDPIGWAFWVGGAGVSGSLRGTKAGEGPVAASMPKTSRRREVSPPILLA